MTPIKAILSITLYLTASLHCVAERPVREVYAPYGLTIGKKHIATDTLPALFSDCRYHLRVDIPPRSIEASWTVRLLYRDSTFTDITLSRHGSSAHDPDYGLPLEVDLSEFKSDSILSANSSETIKKDIDPTIDGWSLTLTALSGQKSLRCSIGQRHPLRSMTLRREGLCGISAYSHSADLRLARLSFFVTDADDLKSSYFDSVELLSEHLAATDNTDEAYWRYLDRDTDPVSVSVGGDYRLATVRRSDGIVEIIYLGGASRNKEFWRPLMIKGLMIPTVFMNHYDLVWYDAFGNRISNETSADIIDNSIIRLNFPLYGNSQIRFARLPESGQAR